MAPGVAGLLASLLCLAAPSASWLSWSFEDDRRAASVELAAQERAGVVLRTHGSSEASERVRLGQRRSERLLDPSIARRLPVGAERLLAAAAAPIRVPAVRRPLHREPGNSASAVPPA